MEESRFDRVLQKLAIRAERISGKIAKDLRNVKPFDMEKVPDKERILNYQRFLENPDIEQELRAQGMEAYVDKYHINMHELINRRKENART